MKSKKEVNLEFLDQIETYAQNWNGYDAEPFSKEHIDFVRSIINSLDIQPFISPTANDSIQLEYEILENYLEYEIFKDGTIKEFTYTNEHKGHIDYVDASSMNERIKNILGEIYGKHH